MNRPPVTPKEFRPQRTAWIRQQKRMPLHQRFKAVLSNNATTLHKQLKEAMLADGATRESFEAQARAILRACMNIPAENGGSQRRRQYVQRCIAGLAPSNGATEDNRYLSGHDLMEQIAKKSRCDFDTVWKATSALLGCYTERWPDNNDRCIAAVRNILTNAQHANNPLRYLRVVIRNEKADGRRQRGKCKPKPV